MDRFPFHRLVFSFRNSPRLCLSQSLGCCPGRGSSFSPLLGGLPWPLLFLLRAGSRCLWPLLLMLLASVTAERLLGLEGRLSPPAGFQVQVSSCSTGISNHFIFDKYRMKSFVLLSQPAPPVFPFSVNGPW